MKVSGIAYGVVFAILLTGFTSNAQQNTDLDLIAAHIKLEPKYEQKRKVEYLFKNKNAFVKYNPVSLFFGGALYIYQSTVSKQIGAQCPYEYNCSNFSRICIRKYGLVKGIFLTSDRLTRCTRLAAIDINENIDIRRSTGRIIDNPDDYSFKDHTH
jgi:putative component of membrane protein insertase Oxa1/YidC/SpoIIIJ protein YidD